jgi:crossover junction endodeoxyribonuclease RusA
MASNVTQLPASRRERRILALIREDIAAGRNPSVNDICDALDLSRAEVVGSLHGLRRKGLLHPSKNGNVQPIRDTGRVTFNVDGTPRPQGSKNAFATDAGIRLVESSGENLHAWRTIVRDEAALHRPPDAPWEGPVLAELSFRLRRPKHPKHELPITTPDVDKLSRAVLDGITEGRILRDDSIVTDLRATKDYTDGSPGVAIALTLIRLERGGTA